MMRVLVVRMAVAERMAGGMIVGNAAHVQRS
jgi:hypothetical protein